MDSAKWFGHVVSARTSAMGVAPKSDHAANPKYAVGSRAAISRKSENQKITRNSFSISILAFCSTSAQCRWESARSSQAGSLPDFLSFLSFCLFEAPQAP